MNRVAFVRTCAMYPLSAGYSTPSRSKISASKFRDVRSADDAGAARAEGLEVVGVANPNFWKSPGCETTLFFPSGTARVYTRGATREPRAAGIAGRAEKPCASARGAAIAGAGRVRWGAGWGVIRLLVPRKGTLKDIHNAKKAHDVSRDTSHTTTRARPRVLRGGRAEMAHRCAKSPYRALASARVAPTRADSRRAASARAWRRAAATSARADSGGDAEATARSRKEKAAPWALMGRSVHERHVGLSREQEDELALGAVADEAGVSLESLRSNLERLERLCPPLAARRERGEVKPARLARLALDLDAVASSMMRLKVLLPNADVAEMCARKPALLGTEAVDRAEAVAAIVGSEYPARFVVPNGARDDENDENELNHSSIKRAETSALLASVPDILLEPCDEAVRAIVTRARALRFLLPNADVARLAGKMPSFLLTSDAGRAASRGGHAAGLEAGRSYAREGARTQRDVSSLVDDTTLAKAKETRDALEKETDSSWFERWHVAVSVGEVRARMPKDCDVDRLLTDFPNILAMDVPALFEDLRAVFPTRDPADVLRTNPKIAYQVRSRATELASRADPFSSRRRWFFGFSVFRFANEAS